jgi:hypothetical protein
MSDFDDDDDDDDFLIVLWAYARHQPFRIL